MSSNSAMQVVLTTDGACIGNPGPGGWACVLRFDGETGEIYGCERQTTNNRMELLAVIEGLRALSQDCAVTLTTDSQYVKKGITEWIDKWKRNGWRTAAKTPVVNQDLWETLDRERRRHQVSWQWTKGHASHVDNLRCDELANRAARQQIASNGMQRRPAAK